MNTEKELKPCPFCGNEFPTINYQKPQTHTM